MTSLFVTAVGAVFLLLQLWCYRLTCAQLKTTTARWRSSCEAGHRKTQSREAAIADLERSLAMSSAFGLLRRLGVVAPLLGVTLTAGSVLFGGELRMARIDSPSGTGPTATDGALLLAVVPLFAGVCAGALLAILNQVLVTLANRLEEKLFIEATDPALASHFRDTEDRLDAIVARMAEGGSRLTDASSTIGSMLGVARDAMQGMSDACNEAVTDLLALAERLESATETPVREFVAAASDLRRVSNEAAKEFASGMKAASARAAEIQSQMDDSLRKHAAAAEVQSKLAQALVEHAARTEAALEPLSKQTVQVFDASLQAAASALREVTIGAAGLDKSFAGASSSMGDASRTMSSQMVKIAEEQSRAIRRSTDEAESVLKRSAAHAEVLAQQSSATAEASRISLQALTELAQLTQRLSQQLGVANGSLRQRASEAAELDSQIASSLKRVISSIREIGGRTSEADPGHSAKRLAELGASIDLIEGRLRSIAQTAPPQNPGVPSSPRSASTPTPISTLPTDSGARVAPTEGHPGGKG